MSPSAPPVWQEYAISDALWARLALLIPLHVPPPHPLGRHRPRLPDRFVLDAIFYVLRTGCQWGALSVTGLCKKTTAHKRFQQWADQDVLARLWEQALLDYDELLGLDWTWLAADGSLHKAPLGGKKTGANPCDRGKGGTKRSLLTVANGVPVGVVIDGANAHDMKLLEATLHSIPPAVEARRQAVAARQVWRQRRQTVTQACGGAQLTWQQPEPKPEPKPKPKPEPKPKPKPEPKPEPRKRGRPPRPLPPPTVSIRLGLSGQHLCLDAGYDYRAIRHLVDQFGFTLHLRGRGAEKKARKAGQQARRWVVEGAHSWLNRYRRLLIRWEKKPELYLSLLHFACAILIWHKVLTHSQTTAT